MKNYNYKKYWFSVSYNNGLLIIKDKDGLKRTIANIDEDENLEKNINYLLTLDYIYNKKYNLMYKIYKSCWYSNYWLYEKAREDAKNTKEREEIEEEKATLLNNL